MDAIIADHEHFIASGSFVSGIDSCQQLIDALARSRQEYAQTTEHVSRMASDVLSQSKSMFENVNANLKDVYKVTQHQGKAFDRRFKLRSNPDLDPSDNISERLLGRAVTMHLLREGQFDVADRFLIELEEASPSKSQEFELLEPISLRKDFLAMYNVLYQMRTHHNLLPATRWAITHSTWLQARRSNLEFELAKLQFLRHLTESAEDGASMRERQTAAVLYARTTFDRFGVRYIHDIQHLMGAMIYCTDMISSPYQSLVQLESAWEEVAIAFTREFCSLLGLSADSPILIATTAGTMALPMLEKLRVIMKEKRTEWTTEHELPVEIPLPLSYRFHPIFVCPVSKEQTTDRNPPMLLPCGHVIAKESLSRLSKAMKFKCPYCPEESHHRDAREVML